MKAEDIKKILVIGAGTMAAHIGGQFALFGRDVVVFARSQAKADTLIERIKNEVYVPRIAEGFFTQEFADKAIKRVSFIIGDPSLTPQDVDLVSESVYEDYDAKQEVWETFAPYLPKHAILTTDSSSLSATRYKEATGAPERFMAWHFYMPSFIRNVTDIFPMPETKPEYVEVIKELAKSLNMNGCELKIETPGYLANNMLYSFVDMGLTLYRTGAADIEDIDRAWMGVRQEQSGPFGIMDLAGVDTFLLIMKNWRLTTPENLPILEEKVAKGELGAKAGKGFYTYPNPSFQQPDFLKRAQKLKK